MKVKTKRKPNGEGDCYDANGREFLDLCRKNKNPNVTYLMVHGVVINSSDGKPMGHAWIEATHKLGDIEHVVCLDFANNHAHSLSKETYYFIGRIDESLTFKYEHDDYSNRLVESGNWGNWELNVDR